MFKHDRPENNPFKLNLDNLSLRLGQVLLNRDKRVVTIESCTGGSLASAITEVPGSSQWFDRSLVTYTNQSKCDLAAVPMELIDAHGAVSIEVAEAMAIGGLDNSQAHFSISVTGIAGPDGGTREKPVGTTCFGWAYRGADGSALMHSEKIRFEGNRIAVRVQAACFAMETLCRLIDS